MMKTMWTVVFATVTLMTKIMWTLVRWSVTMIMTKMWTTFRRDSDDGDEDYFGKCKNGNENVD